MDASTSRRKFFKAALSVPAWMICQGTFAFSDPMKERSHKFKLSLNLYSFDAALKAGKMDLFGALDFCAENNFDAIDPTGYYFPGYPEVPSDAFINTFKRQAFLLGIAISGTGIRNDFADPNTAKRKAHIERTKKWIETAAKLGSPHLRIFTGTSDHKGYTRPQVMRWIADDIRTCCEYGKQYGVMIALQNHNEFLKTADDVDQLFEWVGSDWLGLNLDIGSYRQKDPYGGNSTEHTSRHHMANQRDRLGQWIRTAHRFYKVVQNTETGRVSRIPSLGNLGPW